MTEVKGWMNVYRSGYFHRAGKPCAYDRHAGDLYPTEDAARKDIEPASHYVATVPVSWHEAVPCAVNPENSTPVPLRDTRSGKVVVA